MTSIHLLRERVAERLDDFLDDIASFVRIPSVTTDQMAIGKMASATERRFQEAGFHVTRGQVEGGHPIFIARKDGLSPRRLLFFNHYDVDAPGPTDLWETPPFDPIVKDGNLFGRGVADNKASLLSRLHAVETLISLNGELPCGVTFLIEAKKSMDAPHLGLFVDDHRELLKADACLWENSTVSPDGTQPTFRLGDKGMLMVRVVCTGTAVDLSSQYAPVFPSAAWKLVAFLSRIKDSEGEVAVPGFRNDIVSLSSEELELLRAMPVTTQNLAKLGGVELENDPELIVRYFTEPTANIASLKAGPRSGQEMMSVNPAEASASLDFRLVPSQEPNEIAAQLQGLASDLTDNKGSVNVEVLGTMNPSRTPVNHPFVQKLRESALAVYGRQPVLEPLSPAVGSRSVLAWSGMPVAGYGVAYSGSNIQAPNEHIRLDDYVTGVVFIAWLLKLLGEESLPTESS